jgi:putative membrane protein
MRKGNDMQYGYQRPKRTLRRAAMVAAGTVALGAAAQGTRQLPLRQNEGVTTAESSAAARNTPAKDSESVDFLLYALRSSLAEADMGAVAQQQSRNPAIQAYGKKLHDDHARTANEIKAALAPLDVTAPSEPNAAAQSRRDALAKLAGPEFDAAFLPLMVSTHKEAIEKFGAQTHANPDQQLADLAARTLPMLQQHLDTAQRLQTDHSGH